MLKINPLLLSKYAPYSFDPFIENWQYYYKTNWLTFNQELDILKTNLDSSSLKYIDDFVNLMLFKLKTPSNKYLIKRSYLYNSKDIAAIKKETFTDAKIKQIQQRYKLPKYFNIPAPSFKYHNGLKFLPKSITKDLYQKTVIDGGAYYGDSSFMFAKYQPQHIYAIEPNSINFSNLQININNNALNHLITPINSALGCRLGKINMGFKSLEYPNLGASIVYNHRRKKQEEVILTTIDNIVQQNHIISVGLIKLDVEGYELEALLGGLQTIKQYRPILLIAIYHTLEEFLKTKPLLADLNLGYKFIMQPLEHQELLKEFYLIAYVD